MTRKRLTQKTYAQAALYMQANKENIEGKTAISIANLINKETSVENITDDHIRKINKEFDLQIKIRPKERSVTRPRADHSHRTLARAIVFILDEFQLEPNEKLLEQVKKLAQMSDF
ncbi:hypothetical protein THIOSC15_2720008 [uncultured Thiomicrorhabdus sp.]